MMKLFKYIMIVAYFELSHYVHDLIDAADHSYAFEVTFGAGIILALFIPTVFPDRGKDKCKKCELRDPK